MSALDMGADRVSSLMKSIAIPACVGMLFNTLYNLVDTWFAGWLSHQALAALSISSSYFFLMLALGIGIGQSANAAVSFLSGQGERRVARHMAAQSLCFSALVSSVVAVIAGFICDDVFYWLAGDADYMPLAVEYTRALMPVCPLFCVGFVLSALLNTQGDSRSYRNALIFAFILNVGLNPLLMTRMGLSGIAIATAMTQVFVLLYLVWKIHATALLSDLHWREFMPRKKPFIHLLKLAIPASVSMMVVAFGTMILLSFVAHYGQDAVAAFGVALRMEQLVLLPVVGLGIAASSLCAYSYGACDMPRVLKVYWVVSCYGLLVSVVGGALLVLGRWPLMALFTDQSQVLSIGAEYLYYSACMLPANAAIFAANAILQGLRHMGLVLMHSLWRQVLLPMLILSLVLYGWQGSLAHIWQSLMVFLYLAAMVLHVNVLWVLRKKQCVSYDPTFASVLGGQRGAA